MKTSEEEGGREMDAIQIESVKKEFISQAFRKDNVSLTPFF